MSAHTKDGGSLLRLSQCLLLTHEDKTFEDAFMASLRIPWGVRRTTAIEAGINWFGRAAMVQIATTLLARGHTESPLLVLLWLACVQRVDDSLPQSSSIACVAYWKGIQ